MGADSFLGLAFLAVLGFADLAGFLALVFVGISGNVIWSTPLKETRTVKKSSGGKGGGKKSSQTTYSYSASFAVGLCLGPVATVRRIWADTKVIYDASASNTQSTEKYPGVVRIHRGGEDEEPDATLEMHLGAGNVPAFRGLCYLVFDDLQLKDFANRIPNISAEVVADGDMQSDIFVFPPATTMTKEGGILDQSRGMMIGTGSDHVWKYDCINNRFVLERSLEDPNWSTAFPGANDVFGDFCGIDSQGSPAVPTLEGSRSPYAGARRPITCEMVGRAARFSRLRRTLLGQRGHIGDFLKLIEDIPMVLGEVKPSPMSASVANAIRVTRQFPFRTF